MAPNLLSAPFFLLTLYVGCTDSESDKNTDNGTVEDTETHTDTGSTEDTAVYTEADEEEDIFGECGDGIVNSPTEECDDGENNANTPDACRTDCLLPKCGDGILDSDEECDDSNLWNIDGCDDTCSTEAGDFEAEPNDDSMEANLLASSGTIRGMLWEGDVDCYTFEFQDNDYIDLRLNPEQEECSHLIMLRTYEDGEEISSDLPVDDSCTKLDPQVNPNARYLAGSDTTEITYCVEGLFGTAVEEYTIEWEIFSDSCSLIDPELTESEDVDGDLLANNCDDDDDGDGLLDAQDNCSLVANNGECPFYTTDGGFIRTWNLSDPFQVTGMTVATCNPVVGLFEIAETDLQPSLSITALDYNEDTVQWNMYTSPTDVVNFTTIPYLASLAAPREVFAGMYVYSDTTRSVDAKFGPDDGGRVWVNGTLIGETLVCQGASADKYTYPTTLNAGWNRVVVQIHDNGGGWGFYFRFMESGTSLPITDLTLSPVHTGVFQDYQSDSDGDGIGDQCDLFD